MAEGYSKHSSGGGDHFKSVDLVLMMVRKSSTTASLVDRVPPDFGNLKWERRRRHGEEFRCSGGQKDELEEFSRFGFGRSSLFPGCDRVVRIRW